MDAFVLQSWKAIIVLLYTEAPKHAEYYQMLHEKNDITDTIRPDTIRKHISFGRNIFKINTRISSYWTKIKNAKYSIRIITCT